MLNHKQLYHNVHFFIFSSVAARTTLTLYHILIKSKSTLSYQYVLTLSYIFKCGRTNHTSTRANLPYFIFWLNLNLLSPRSIYSCYPIFSSVAGPTTPENKSCVYDRSNIVFLSKFHILKRGRTNHTSMRANLPSGAHQDLTCRSTW